ncbi:MAG: hypothetical protein GY898_01715 [Proteobacteria bacterium]|nr:hypothetical protein [Pseudomonadota bacterium]
MRLLAAIGALLLGGCVLPEPGTLTFVEDALVTDGELVREYRWGTALAGQGYVDCEASFDADGGSGDPEGGCPGGCATTLVVDFDYAGTDCPMLPAGSESDLLSVSIGIDGDTALLHDGDAWATWIEGSTDGGSFDGDGPWLDFVMGAGEDFQMRERLSLTWVGE